MSTTDHFTPLHLDPIGRAPEHGEALFGADYDPAPVSELRSQIGDVAAAGVVLAFREESRERADALQAAVAGGDRATAEREAHTMRSASAALGAQTMSAACALFEDVCRYEERIDRDLAALVIDAIEQTLRGGTSAN